MNNFRIGGSKKTRLAQSTGADCGGVLCCKDYDPLSHMEKWRDLTRGTSRLPAATQVEHQGILIFIWYFGTGETYVAEERASEETELTGGPLEKDSEDRWPRKHETDLAKQNHWLAVLDLRRTSKRTRDRRASWYCDGRDDLNVRRHGRRGGPPGQGHKRSPRWRVWDDEASSCFEDPRIEERL